MRILFDSKNSAFKNPYGCVETDELCTINIHIPQTCLTEKVYLCLEGEKKLIAEKIGRRIGRWIYIVDAFDDYDKDRESGSYNPFVELYSGNPFTEDDLLSISKMLEAELALAFSALELLDENGDATRSEIIKNILCLGMPESVDKICKKTTKNKKVNSKQEKDNERSI